MYCECDPSAGATSGISTQGTGLRRARKRCGLERVSFYSLIRRSFIQGFHLLQIRPGCESCNVDLAPDSTEAWICSFERASARHALSQAERPLPQTAADHSPCVQLVWAALRRDTQLQVSAHSTPVAVLRQFRVLARCKLHETLMRSAGEPSCGEPRLLM